jgi:hypothetical protein
MTIRIGREPDRHHASLKFGSSSWLLCVSLDVGPACLTAEAARAIGVRFDFTTTDEAATLAGLGFVSRITPR